MILILYCCYLDWSELVSRSGNSACLLTVVLAAWSPSSSSSISSQVPSSTSRRTLQHYFHHCGEERGKVLLSSMLSSNLWNEFCAPPDWKFCSAPAAPNWLAKGDATKLQRRHFRETIGRITLVSPTLQIWTDNCADHLNPNFYYILMGSRFYNHSKSVTAWEHSDGTWSVRRW